MDPSTPRVGDILGHYRLLEQVGQGGMGVVFRARDEKLNRDVAVKIIAPGLLADDEARRRFRTEARTLCRLNHPNIQTVHDFDSQDANDFLVAEFIQGTSLDRQVAAGPLAPGQVIALGKQLLSALAAAHAAGIVHRDLKPANLKLRPDGHLKVLDFGLAKQLPTDDAVTRDSATVTGAIAGTLPYLAPEVLRGAPADQRSDIYAVGAVLYELATGHRPHPEHGGLLVDAVLNRAPIPPSTLNRELPPPLEHAILKALDKNPEYRWSSARELERELDRISGRATAASPVAPRAARMPRRVLLGAVAAMLALVAALAWSWRSLSGPAAPRAIESLAVLPLQDLSENSAHDYFAEAMSEELTNEIAGLRSIRVISRSSARMYADRKKPLREIARDLGVDALVEGSVLRADDRVRVTVQLVDAATDRQVWSRSYDRRGSDIIALQRVVAQAIAQEIHLTLSPVEQRRLATAMTGNAQAYEAYLRAIYRIGKTFENVSEVEAALQHAEEAVRLDPNFAEAHVAVARACTGRIFAWGGGAEYDERAFVALGNALALNPDLADAYVVRGNLRFTNLHGFDIVGAVGDYRKALSLNPNLAAAHHGLGSELMHTGLHEQARQALQATLRLAPHESGAIMRLGRALWQSNRFAEAIEHYERHGLRHVERAIALAFAGRRKEAWELLGGPIQSPHRAGMGQIEDLAGAAALLAALEGDRGRAGREIQRSIAAGQSRDHFHHAAFTIAAAYAELGNPREAVRWLTLAVDRGMPNLPLFRDNPSMRKLRGTAEYDAFIARLEPRWEAIRAAITN